VDGPDGKERKTVVTIVDDGKEQTWSDGTLATSEWVDEHHLKGTRKKNDCAKTVDAMASADGKTLTLHFKRHGFNAGRPLDEIEVFDRFADMGAMRERTEVRCLFAFEFGETY
jgi:hypothetical protein